MQISEETQYNPGPQTTHTNVFYWIALFNSAV